MVSSPVTVFGTVIFGTNKPTDNLPGTCGNLGEARLYQIGFKTGNAVQDLNDDGVVDANDRSEVLAGGGFPPSPCIRRSRSREGRRGLRRNALLQAGGANFDTRRQRTYWYKKQ